MTFAETAGYPPLNVLKPVADEVWIVDGPVIRFGLAPFPTRMTIIRLANGGLFIHSPTPLTVELREAVAGIGLPRWIIGPNRLHYWWIPEWRRAYPGAEVHLAPGVRQQAGRRIDFPAFDLPAEGPHPWEPEIATLAMPGDFMTEFDFFHRKSRTLVLTDLIENFEPARLSWPMRLLTRLGGVQAPDGQTPRDMRLAFWRRRPELKRGVEKMLTWRPDRVVLAHGAWYRTNAAEELRRAFRWLD